MNVVLREGWRDVYYGAKVRSRPSAPAAARCALPLFRCKGIPLDTLTAPPRLVPHHHGSTLSLSLAGSFFRYYTDSLPLSGTGLFFLWRCQNPTIHSHRVTSHPARAKKGKEEEGWTTEISESRTSGFFYTFPHTTGSSSRRVVTVSSAPAVPKTPS